MTKSARLLVVGAFLAWSTATSPSRAIPSVNDARPKLRLVDAWDRTLDIEDGTVKGKKAILVVYEDRDTSKQNKALKDDLAKLEKEPKFAPSMVVVAVADLTAYDFWPVKGVARDAVREESRKFGTSIFCDWDGTARSKLQLRQGFSNVVLYGKEGKVLFASEGALSAESRQALLALVRAQIGL